MTVVDRVLSYSWVMGVLGLVGIGVALLLGFEEPVQPLLSIGTGMVLMPPVVVAAHLMWTGALTPGEKRSWLRELLSWHAGSALASYLRSADRRTALRDLEIRRIF